MKRYLTEPVRKDLGKKIILITGPRQSGKTTLAKMINLDHEYLNYDYAEHRLLLKEKSWDRKKPLLILDEIHKKRDWKRYLKGIYDVEGLNPPIIVTGSARLDTVKKSGDSLAGRYFQFRLHPLDIKELQGIINPSEALRRLKEHGGFPEPFLENDPVFSRRWRKSHLDIILRQDLLDLEPVRNIQRMETLIELLKGRVGSTVSYASLARDIECSPKSVKSWLQILENMYVVFAVRPFYRNVARAILKEPKYYFYDTGQIERDEGAKLENLVAGALRKELHYLEDVYGFRSSLHFIRNKQGAEIDFLVQIEEERYLIEVKSADDALSPNFRIFSPFFPGAGKVQLVERLDREKTFPDGSEVRDLADWLQRLDLRPADKR